MSDTVAMWDAIKSLEEAHAALVGEFQRLDERVTDFMVDCQQQSIAALESQSAAPDPVCADPNCGHRHSDHYDKGCNVEVLGAFGVRYVCTCRKFVPVPTAEPEPAPLDPVLVAEVADILRHSAVQSLDFHSTAECVVVAINTYGRDGAR